MSVVTSEPVSVWGLGAPLGEGPVWVERDQALWFVDIKSHKIHRFDPASGDRKSWDAPGQIGFVLPAQGGGFVAGLQSGLSRFDEKTGDFAPLSAPEPDKPGNRLNDGTVDSKGRLWFGSMDDAEKGVTGAIYRLGADGECVCSSPLYAITNGPAVSPDGRTLYHVDTLGGVIYACDVGDDGSLDNRRVFATVPNTDGFPDGPTVDSEGCVWVGLYAGWGVRRFSPNGDTMETVRFPVSAVTKIAFGGPGLKTAFATTAAKHLTPELLEREPRAGDLFRFEVDVAGVSGLLVREGV